MFWNSWTDLWNGDLDEAPKLIAPGLQTHAAMLDGSSSSAIDGPAAMAAWIGQTRSVFDDMRFQTLAGPVIDGHLIAGHWRASGRYTGGMTGTTAPAGTEVAFSGTDVLRLADGKVVEYWLVSDTLSLLAQLGVLGPGTDTGTDTDADTDTDTDIDTDTAEKEPAR